MRYYDITITDPDTGTTIKNYTSYKNGKHLAGALNVELDITTGPFATPIADSSLRIWGVTLEELSQATDLTGKNIVVRAGMSDGLPLANSAQQGVIAKGVIFNSWGNWIGKDMTLDLVIKAGSATSGDTGTSGTNSAPKNIVLNWKKGQTLGDALKSAISAAFPNYTASINISSDITAPEDLKGVYSTLEQLARFVNKKSILIKGSSTYAGVDIVLARDTVSVFDGTVSPDSTTQIKFQDMIGQPTWSASYSVNLKTVMRGDLSIPGIIKLPETIYTTTTGAISGIISKQLKNKSIFTGEFMIAGLRHVGNFRQPDGNSWCTIIDLRSMTVA